MYVGGWGGGEEGGRRVMYFEGLFVAVCFAVVLLLLFCVSLFL